MTFYEAGVNSMLTGYCFVGQHVVSDADIGINCTKKLKFFMRREYESIM